MSKFYSASQIKELEDGIAVTAFKGKIKKIGKRFTGTSEKGDWSFQDVYLVDPSGEEIKGKLKDRDELDKKLLNQQVCLVAHKGDHGWTGLKAKDDTYKDETTRVLWITSTAEIVKGGELPADDAGGEPEPGDAPEPPEETPARQERPAKPTQGDPVRDAKVAALKRANLLAICLRAADSMLQVYHDSGKVNPTPELHQACSISIFIALDRQAMSDDLPVAPVYPPKPDGDLEPEKPKGKNR